MTRKDEWTKSITLAKKSNKQNILIITNTIRRGSKYLSLDHFLRIFSLFSKEISEKL